MGLKVDELMNSINKEFKEELLHKGLAKYNYDRIPFTSPKLNAMTFGGIPMGKLIEFYGEEHGGKTTTCLDIVANYQHMDDSKGVIYADLENTLDSVWATKLGVDLDSDDFYIFNPTNQGAETIFEKILELIATDEVGLVVIDSLGVMVSNQALEKSVEEKTYGGISMALTNFSKKAEMLCHRHNCTIIGINQIRADLNSPYGGTTTPGGKAWKHNVAVRMEFRMGKYFDDKGNDLSRQSENPAGNYVMVSMTKNKTCPPTNRTGYYTLRYDIGIDYIGDLIGSAIKYGVIDKAGAWMTILNPETGEQITKVQGQAKVREFLSDQDNIEVLKLIEDFVNESIKQE